MNFVSCFSKVFSRVFRKVTNVRPTGRQQLIESAAPVRKYKKRRSPEQCAAARERILDCLMGTKETLTTREIANRLNMPLSEVRTDTAFLSRECDNGIISEPWGFHYYDKSN